MSELESLLRRVVEALDSAGVPFMVAGSFASTTHGLQRTTQDLDVVIDPADEESLSKLICKLPLDSYYLRRCEPRSSPLQGMVRPDRARVMRMARKARVSARELLKSLAALPDE